jgi:two-component system sensor histidine kinase/response regulator
MGGEIDASSEPGEGSVFSFAVPFEPAGEPVEGAAASLREVSGGRALVVDDNDTAREVLAEGLRSMSLEAESAASAEQALEMLQAEEAAPFDLVLLDWRMPGMDGLEAARRIRGMPEERRPRVIMVTAYGREEILRQAEQAGVESFLVKPVAPSLLQDAVAKVLGGAHGEPVGLGARRRKSLQAAEHVQGASALVVEDNTVNQQVAREMLQRAGLRVEVADGGREALKILESQAFDIVFMDVQMPGMDGYQTTQRIRENPDLAATPIAAMTAHALPRDRERSLQAGMNDHLSKPIDPDRLLEVLNTWVKPAEGRPQAPEADGEDGDLPQLPGVDVDQGVRRVGGKAELYHRLLSEMCSEYGDIAAQIQKYLDQGDAESARRAAHSLKGMAGNLSAHKLQSLAADAEQAVQSGDHAAVQEPLEGIREAMAGLRDSLCVVPDAGAPEAEGAVDKAEASRLARKLSERIAAYDPEAEQTLESLEQALGARGGEALARLTRAVSGFDFKSAANALRDLTREQGLDIGETP